MLRLVLLGAAIGIPAALAAIAFFTAVHYLEQLIWHILPTSLGEATPPWYLVVFLPIVGAAIVAAARLALPGDGGRPPLGGMAHGPTPVAFVPGIVVAALGTLGFGLVLGPEAPVMAVGSAVGLAITSVVRSNAREERRPLDGRDVLCHLDVVRRTARRGRDAHRGRHRLGPRVDPGARAGVRRGGRRLPGLPWRRPLHRRAGAGPPDPDLPAYPGTSIPDLTIAIVVGVVTAALIVAINRSASGLAARQDRRLGDRRTARRRAPRRRASGRPARPARDGVRRRGGGRAVLRPGLDPGPRVGVFRRRAGGPRARQGRRVRDQPGSGVPRWSDLPGGLPRCRRGGVRGPAVRHITDLRGRDRMRGTPAWLPDASRCMASRMSRGTARRLRRVRRHRRRRLRDRGCVPHGHGARSTRHLRPPRNKDSQPRLADRLVRVPGRRLDDPEHERSSPTRRGPR